MGLFRKDNNKIVKTKEYIKNRDGYYEFSTKNELYHFVRSLSKDKNGKRHLPKIKLRTKNANNWFDFDQSEVVLGKTIPLRNTIETIEKLDTTECTSIKGLFRGLNGLIELPKIDLTNIDSLEDLCMSCINLRIVPELDTSKVKNYKRSFYDCRKLKTFPKWNTIKGETFEAMFERSGIIYAPELDTRNGTNFENTFFWCKKLISIPLYNMKKAKKVNGFVWRCDLDDETKTWVMNVSLSCFES